MAQVATRCRATGHYIFMGIETDDRDFARKPGPIRRKYCPFCASEHLWYREDSTISKRRTASQPHFQQAS
jgi:hypothetical protein